MWKIDDAPAERVRNAYGLPMKRHIYAFLTEEMAAHVQKSVLAARVSKSKYLRRLVEAAAERHPIAGGQQRPARLRGWTRRGRTMKFVDGLDRRSQVHAVLPDHLSDWIDLRAQQAGLDGAADVLRGLIQNDMDAEQR